MIAMAPPDSQWIPLSSPILTKMVTADLFEASGFNTGAQVLGIGSEGLQAISTTAVTCRERLLCQACISVSRADGPQPGEQSCGLA